MWKELDKIFGRFETRGIQVRREAWEPIDEAIRWTEEAKTINPNRAVANVNLEELYYELNRTEDARVNYEKWLQLEPNSAYARPSGPAWERNSRQKTQNGFVVPFVAIAPSCP